MLYNRKVLWILSFCAVLFTTIFFSCSRKDKLPPRIDPAFSNYISAFTSGVISAESTIKIRLAEKPERDMNLSDPIDMDLFEFDPDIEGQAYWLDDYTVEFRPEQKLDQGETFDVSFDLSALVDVPEDLETFRFQFQTITQQLDINFEGIKTYKKRELQWQKMLATVTTADVVDDASLESCFTATQNGENLHITWIHDPDRRFHHIQVDSVHRQDDAQQVILRWNGETIGVDEEKKEVFEIPALGDFKVMDYEVVQQPDQYAIFRFSDPLLEDQDLEGLIHFDTDESSRIMIDDNEIRIYPSVRQTGDRSITLDAGIRNILGYKMGESKTFTVTFEDIKPAIRLTGNGVIVPQNSGLTFPFEAVNLRAVDVEIIRIYENNIAQFLQVNQMDGNRELRRVGRPVLKKTLQLKSDKPVDYGRWNAFKLDLSRLISAEPGAIYKVNLSFKRAYSMYPCAGDEEIDETMRTMSQQDDWNEEDESDDSYWDFYDEYYYDYYYYDDYDWRERDNPCNNTYYYQSERKVSRNIMASDFGIIAKAGSDKKMIVAVSDLVSSDPLSGVNIDVYNYQNQKIASATTDADGMTNLQINKKPFLLIASKGVQRGYLRLDDASSLSLSKFDVWGAAIQKGIKGFIYGERGVWRPGDSLYLSFILEDKEKLLPTRHPVKFELINPKDQTVVSMVRTTSVDGFYDFRTKTSDDAITGNYRARVKVGGATFTKTVKIETVKPNHLKLNLDFGVDRLSAGDNKLAGDLEVKWLHGAVASNLKADVKVDLRNAHTGFKRYQDYIFDDPARSFEAEEIGVYEGRVDENGHASVKAAIYPQDDAPGMLRAYFTVRAFEESGDFSIDRFSIPFSPYNTYVGISVPKGDKSRHMLLTDTTHTIDIITVDADGKAVQANNLVAKLYKVNWRWWWDQGSDNGLADYIGSYNVSPIIEKKIATNSKGEAKFNIKVDYPDWGRYLVRVEDMDGGHATGQTVYMDWPGWAGRAQRENPGGASMLTFTTNKPKYNVGETCTVQIPTGGTGRALVSIESGSKVITDDWVQAQKDMTAYSFKVTPEMTPNVYVNVTLVQPHNQTKNDLPIRLYGVMPIAVEDPDTRLYPQLDMPDVLAPETDFTLSVSEKEGKPMTYTVAIVDEGLLDLTRFKTPSPWDAFYAREALGVRTWDLYDWVLGAFSGEMAGLLALGGDGDLDNGGKKKANRFKPMVRFIGPFKLEKGEKRSHKIHMPQYIGSVRTMVVAGDISHAYGNTEKTTPVRKPLMILATLPRVLGPGEQVKLPVAVFAMEKKVKNVTLEVVPNKMFTVMGNAKKNITFNRIGDEVVTFDLNVKEALGVGKVKILAKSGSEKAAQEIEIDIRNPNPRVTTVIEGVIEKGRSWETAYTPPGMMGTNNGILEVSSIPPIDLGKRLRYLIQYPHGCVEQTTSSVFPQLFAGNLMELDQKSQAKMNDNVKAGIQRLRRFQCGSGGMAYWPGGGEANSWGTNYAFHFLLEAEAKGFDIPSGMKKRLIKYQRSMARQWSPNTTYGTYTYRRNDLIQAYRLYTLALAGQQDIGAMNRLKEQRRLSDAARWRLAAAYQMAGKPEVAKSLIAGLTTQVADYRELSYSYGSGTRDKAMILETLSLMGIREKGALVLKDIAKDLGANRWMSTQTTAYSLLAISKFMGKDKTSQMMVFSYTIGKGKPVSNSTKSPVAQIDMGINGALPGKLKLTNKGSGLLYVRVIMDGIPVKGDDKDEAHDLHMNVTYKTLNGASLDPSRIVQGTDFLAVVTITNPGVRGNYKEMALTQIFPGGWEIHNTRMDEFSSVVNQSIATYQDIRDDRIYTYYTLARNKTVSYVVQLNASYMGHFYLPTVYTEAMYDNTINARKGGQWVDVVRQDEIVSLNQ